MKAQIVGYKPQQLIILNTVTHQYLFDCNCDSVLKFCMVHYTLSPSLTQYTWPSRPCSWLFRWQLLLEKCSAREDDGLPLLRP